MTPTVEEVLDMAAFLCGDPRKKRFTTDVLLRAFKLAWANLFDYMQEAQVADITGQAEYTLPAGTASRTPAQMSISNFGEPSFIGERPASEPSTVQFTPVDVKMSRLIARPSMDRLYETEWRGGTFYFIPATQDIVLQIRYKMSGQAADSGTTGLDNCLNFLAYRTAAIAGPSMQMDPETVRDYDLEARGPNRDGRGGHAQQLISVMVRTLQQEPTQSAAYDDDLYQPGRGTSPYSIGLV